jgi:O-antigen ligase
MIEAVVRYLQKMRFDLVASVMLTVTIVVFAANSTPVAWIVLTGRALKWPTLFVLDVGVVAFLLSRRPSRRPDVTVLILVSALGILALISSSWSVDPQLSLERALSLLMLIVASGALAAASAGDRDAFRRMLLAILAAIVIVAALGIVLALVRPSAAFQSSTASVLSRRYQGFGLNPDTDSMLMALGLPLALWVFSEAGSRRKRVLLGAVVLLLAGSLLASASRGALIAALAGIIVFLLTSRARFSHTGLTIAVLTPLLAVSCAAAIVARDALAAPKPSRPAASGQTGRRPDIGGLQGEIGRGHLPHSFFARLTGSSGRLEAWQGAIEQGNQRPLLGYGFGTEDRVFIDRYYVFQGNRTENAYVGTYLQLGLVGVGLVLGLVGRLVLLFRRAVVFAGERRREVAACGGALTAAFVLGFFQSYLTSVGNVATISVWVLALMLTSAIGAASAPAPIASETRNGSV